MILLFVLFSHRNFLKNLQKSVFETDNFNLFTDK